MRVEKEKLQVDAVKIGKEVERAMVETLRLRMEGEKVRVEVERATQEMERARVELETVRCEIEQHAETERLAAAASFKPPETHSLSPSRFLPVQIHAVPSPVETVPLSAPITTIVGLYATSHMVEEITDAVGKWNSSNNDQYTPAGWAWFKHSETRAFVFIAASGPSEVSWTVEARKRTATVNFGWHFFSGLEMSRGYGGFIYGGRNESGERDRVSFKAI